MERSCLSLLYATLITASAKWRGVIMTPAILRKLDKRRGETTTRTEEMVESWLRAMKRRFSLRPFLFSMSAVLAAGCLAAAPTSNQTARTTAGELKIGSKGSNGQCPVLLAGKAVQKFDCQVAYPPRLLGHFKGSFGTFQEVVVWQETPMGNACNGGPLHILGIRRDGSYELAGPLDFCGGPDPVLKQDAGRIAITIPGSTPNRGTGTIPTEVWQYENGKLRKVK